jgi:hypothetical protein
MTDLDHPEYRHTAHVHGTLNFPGLADTFTQQSYCLASVPVVRRPCARQHPWAHIGRQLVDTVAQGPAGQDAVHCWGRVLKCILSQLEYIQLRDQPPC